MDNSLILPVILAGGSGERLWPLSRLTQPKQFINLLGTQLSLFQATVQRVSKPQNFLPPLVICHEEHRFLVAEQMRQIDVTPSSIILEPIAKNTAPAIAIAAHWAQIHAPRALLLILPADHYLPDHAAFAAAVTQGISYADNGKIVTFGVPATRPETGYGYIEQGAKLAEQCYSIKRFIEKPNHATATKMLNPNFYWNSGMFLFSSHCLLQELQRWQPDIFSITLQALHNCVTDLEFTRLCKKDYAACLSIAIDYAVMEKTNDAIVVALNCTWSDVGSWHAVWEHVPKDAQNNAVVGEVILQDTHNCLISARDRLVTAVDVADLAIIETNDAVLVTKRDNSQGLKSLVASLKDRAHPAAQAHRAVNRPWGYFDSLIKGARFQVKLLVIQPGKSISLQLHHQRSEHWVVVKGKAKVIRGSEEFTLNENESTYIAIGMQHKLANIGKIPLEVIEVQCGNYLGEDDIVRFKEEHAYA